MLDVQTLYSLSDEDTEFQINDRMTFMPYVGNRRETETSGLKQPHT